MPADLLALYWLLLGAAVVLACTAVLLGAAGRSLPWLTPVSLVLLLVAGRWPGYLIPGPLNPDESLMLAQAIKFGEDWLPWRSIDPGTGGPVNSYVLLAVGAMGLPLGFPMARVAALLCLCIHLLLSYLAMRRIGGPVAAGLALLPAAAFFAFATDVDFIHYSSELASMAAISAMLFLIACLPERHAGWNERLPILIGVAAFVVCMSKVQGVPLAAALGASALAVTGGVRAFAVRSALSLAGFLACAVLLCVALLIAGVFDDFVSSFIALPFQYASSPLNWNDFKALVRLKPESLSLARVWLWLLAAAALIYPLHAPYRNDLGRALLRIACAVAVAAGAYLTLTKPGKIFPHYTMYLGLAMPWIAFYLLPWSTNRYTPVRSTHAAGGAIA